jgi:hypothetical protein
MATKTEEASALVQDVVPSHTPTKTPTPAPTSTVWERIAVHGYPKLYKQYQAGFPTVEQLNDMQRLSLWDTITVDAESLARIEHLLGSSGMLRRATPNLIITVYFSTGNSEPVDLGNFGRLNQGLQPNWFLRDQHGEMVKGFKCESGWSGYYNLAAPGLAGYFADFIHSELIETKLFDGIFYDWGATSEFSWINYQKTVLNDGGRIDLDQDGVDETDPQIDSQFLRAEANLHTMSRERWGDEILILGNGGPDRKPEYVTTLNGNMIE